jgi:Holliday junction DNA helicase RuvA
MIGWLQGTVLDPWQQATRCGLLLNCQGVGYDVQVSQRLWARLPAPGAPLTLSVHHTIREDGSILYGFESRQERDLFRELVAVNGVGPQMAMALLGALELEALVKAIVEGDQRLLSQAPGVGKRTAERLSLELREKLQERYAVAIRPADPLPGADHTVAHELRSALLAMGYDQVEIQSALRAVAAQGLDPSAETERWLGDCLRWLSRSAA